MCFTETGNPSWLVEWMQASPLYCTFICSIGQWRYSLEDSGNRYIELYTSYMVLPLTIFDIKIAASFRLKYLNDGSATLLLTLKSIF